MSQLSYLGVGEKTVIAFAAFFLIVEIIKGGKVIWDFLAPKILGIQTEMYRRKELEELTKKNAEQLRLFVEKSGGAITNAVENMEKISDNVAILKQDVDTKFSSMEKNMATLSDTVQDMQLENMRNTILNFGAGAGNNRVYSKEQYEYIKKIYRLYHEIIATSGKTNDEIEITYNQIIMPAYEMHIKKHDFLEYMLENNRLNNMVGSDIDQVNKKPTRRRRKTTTNSEE